VIKPLLIAAALLAAAPAALAPAAVAQETVLRLSETAERTVRPDQLVAVLRAQASGASAAAVQEQVNRQVTAALERARGVRGITATTGSYWTSRSGDRRDQWQATQELRLTTTDASAALLELAGTLQAQGLLMGGLSYEVSRPLARREREAATEEALRGLAERAERLAGIMGLRFAGFREVRVDAPRMMPVPRAMAAPMAASASAPTPPAAEPADVPITATVEGDAILKPR
jgi:predicted secreted protein